MGNYNREELEKYLHFAIHEIVNMAPAESSCETFLNNAPPSLPNRRANYDQR